MPVAIAEVLDLPLLDRADEVVDEHFAGQHADAGVGLMLEDLPACRLEQVRLAQADAAVQEQRVVRLARRVANGQAGRVGKPIARAHDQAVERVFVVEGDFLLLGG